MDDKFLFFLCHFILAGLVQVLFLQVIYIRGRRTFTLSMRHISQCDSARLQVLFLRLINFYRRQVFNFFYAFLFSRGLCKYYSYVFRWQGLVLSTFIISYWIVTNMQSRQTLTEGNTIYLLHNNIEYNIIDVARIQAQKKT